MTVSVLTRVLAGLYDFSLTFPAWVTTTTSAATW